jgi:hypothetical protein
LWGNKPVIDVSCWHTKFKVSYFLTCTRKYTGTPFLKPHHFHMSLFNWTPFYVPLKMFFF